MKIYYANEIDADNFDQSIDRIIQDHPDDYYSKPVEYVKVSDHRDVLEKLYLNLIHNEGADIKMILESELGLLKAKDENEST